MNTINYLHPAFYNFMQQNDGRHIYNIHSECTCKNVIVNIRQPFDRERQKVKDTENELVRGKKVNSTIHLLYL